MNGFITAKEAAEAWGITVSWVQLLCAKGSIPGAMKFGSIWIVPEDAQRPSDGRIKSGKYKDWRKKKGD